MRLPSVNLQVLIAKVAQPVIRRTMEMRASQLDRLPMQPGRVLFLGDSITEQGVWDEWFPELAVINRGTGGDSIAGVRGRLDGAIVSPVAISLLIGTNDLGGLGKSRDVEEIARQFRELVDDIRARAPETTLLINSVMPRTKSMAETIKGLNHRYAGIAVETGATYVDLWPALADSRGALKAECTRDHTHLTGAGYEAWVETLRPSLARFAVVTPPSDSEES